MIEVGAGHLGGRTVVRHAPQPWCSVADDQLLVNGQPLSAIVQQAGHTPLYVCDSSVMTHRIAQLRQALPSDIRIHYAIKANLMPRAMELVRTLTDGLDVASVGELRLALKAGATAHTIGFAGPGKTKAELIEAAHRSSRESRFRP